MVCFFVFLLIKVVLVSIHTKFELSMCLVCPTIGGFNNEQRQFAVTRELCITELVSFSGNRVNYLVCVSTYLSSCDMNPFLVAFTNPKCNVGTGTIFWFTLRFD